MRPALALFAVLSMMPCGCSALLAGSGSDLSGVNTRDKVRARFGEPDSAGIDKDGREYETFRSRRKYAEPMIATRNVMAAGMTLGLSEFYFLPEELWRGGRRVVRGEDVRFSFDETGSVRDAKVGECSVWTDRIKQPSRTPRAAFAGVAGLADESCSPRLLGAVGTAGEMTRLLTFAATPEESLSESDRLRKLMQP